MESLILTWDSWQTQKAPIVFKNSPLWYKDAVIYEVPVRSFADSNGDGIGDLGGLTDKLDYLQDLGITALWLLPFFPSPLKDDGYDVSDYGSVNPIYGTLEDFQNLVKEAHRRHIYIIIELIINHTSDQHPWFKRARKAPPGTVERNFYVWSDTPDRYKEARIIFQDFETSNWTWDSVAQSYYWHRFYSHQPDLNFDQPEVQTAVFEMLDFWLAMGVDGLRMDAVPYLYEREGTNCENLAETHHFLQAIRQRIDSKYPDRMLLAEANQWPEDAVQYYGTGNECHMNFHFPLMPRLFMALHMEDNFPIIDILQQTPPIPDNCQWAIFLRNHDELTLEMVSDEDRDYMYRVYAKDPQARLNLGIRRRLAPLLGNNRRKIELLNALLFSLPGTPVMYYGDEIGMGDNIYLGDRNGVRTPMQWSNDRNAGFSRANPQKLYAPVIVDPEYHYETVNVESQRANASSLWWWMKRLIAVRKRYQAFGRGTLTFLPSDNRKVLAFVRTYAGQHILVVANLSRFVQGVELDLSPFRGMAPIEIFGRTEFPPILEGNYFLSLGPHSFYWFTLELQSNKENLCPTDLSSNILSWQGEWQQLFYDPNGIKQVELILPSYLCSRSWYGGKHQVIQQLTIKDVLTVENCLLLLLHIEYQEGDPAEYTLPLSYAQGEPSYLPMAKESILFRLEGGVVYEGLGDQEFLQLPLQSICQGKSYQGRQGKILPTLLSHELQGGGEPTLLKAQQSNSSIIYGDRLVFKFYRLVGEGINPDLEIGRYLGSQSQESFFVHPLGYWEYRSNEGESKTLGTLMEFVPEVEDGWLYTTDCLRNYFERVMTQPPETLMPELPSSLPLLGIAEIPDHALDLMGSFLASIELLGKRTAMLHNTLASPTENQHFAPEPFTFFYQRSIYQYMRNLTGQNLLALRKHLEQSNGETHRLGQQVWQEQSRILDLLGQILHHKITAHRIRCHGDYHLGQVLFTGKDFIIIDFEGDINRPLSERRMKRSPLRDVAGMLQSIFYAVDYAIKREISCGIVQSSEGMADYGRYFAYWGSGVFLRAYFEATAGAIFIPQSPQETKTLLMVYLMERSVYDLGLQLKKGGSLSVYLHRIQEILAL